jgi:sigma-E factor negative regulatory protein RseC
MVTVFCGEITACFGCMNQECKSNKRIITAENSDHLDLSPGQVVEIENNSTSAFIQFLQAFIPLVVGFIAAYFIVRLLFPGSSEGMRAAAGSAGFLLAGVATYLYRKKFPVKNNPRVVKVIDSF